MSGRTYFGLVTLSSRWGDTYQAYLGFRDTARSAVVKTAAHAQRRLNPHVYLPPTPLTASIREYHYGIYNRANVYPYLDQEVGSVYAPLENIDTPERNRLQNIAVTRALANLKDQKVNYAQAFAERAQTARLVESSALKIGKSLVALRKGNFPDAAAALGLNRKLFKHGKGTSGSIGDNWLELQYGWKPLLSDVYGSMDELARKDDETKDRYRVTVRGTANSSYSSRYTSAVNGQVGATGMVRYHKGCRVSLDYNYTNPVTGTLARLGISDPLTLAWELLPYSFVADWFLPVGSYLQSMSAANGYSYLGGYSTYHQECTVKDSDWGPGGRSTPNYYPAVNGSTYCKNVERTVFYTSPIPRFPGLKNPLSLTHMANAIALLSGSVRVR